MYWISKSNNNVQLLMGMGVVVCPVVEYFAHDRL